MVNKYVHFVLRGIRKNTSVLKNLGNVLFVMVIKKMKILIFVLNVEKKLRKREKMMFLMDYVLFVVFVLKKKGVIDVLFVETKRPKLQF
jgi:hypothetical protein